MIISDRSMLSQVNWGVIFLAIVLFGIGVLNLYSASGFRQEAGMALRPYYQLQMYWGAAGLGVMLICTLFDYRYLKLIVWPLLGLIVCLLISVLVFGKVISGAQRWLDLGFFNLQPSEIAKVGIIIIAAVFLSKTTGKMGWKELIVTALICMVPAGLILIQPDLGTAMLLILILGGMIMYRGLALGVLKVLAVVLPIVVVIGFFGLHDYQRQRLLTFMNPEENPRGAGYHTLQAQIAIGSGQLLGKGFLEGTQSQLRFLPEKHTDFAVAVFAEEWGFVGTMGLIVLFCAFLYSIYITARDAKDAFGSFIATGVFFYFFWQFFINIGMVVGIMPVVGVPLPFISYGGSSTLVNFCLVGLVANVSMRRYLFKKN